MQSLLIKEWKKTLQMLHFFVIELMLSALVILSYSCRANFHKNILSFDIEDQINTNQ